MTEREKILDEIERFLRKTGMNATHFGIESVGRRNLLNHLRDGRGLHIDSAAKIRELKSPGLKTYGYVAETVSEVGDKLQLMLVVRQLR